MLECVGTLEYQALRTLSSSKVKQALRIGLELTLVALQLTSASFTPLLPTNMTTNGETVSAHTDSAQKTAKNSSSKIKVFLGCLWTCMGISRVAANEKCEHSTLEEFTSTPSIPADVPADVGS